MKTYALTIFQCDAMPHCGPYRLMVNGPLEEAKRYGEELRQLQRGQWFRLYEGDRTVYDSRE
jgi:hypothetical protein